MKKRSRYERTKTGCKIMHHGFGAQFLIGKNKTQAIQLRCRFRRIVKGLTFTGLLHNFMLVYEFQEASKIASSRQKSKRDYKIVSKLIIPFVSHGKEGIIVGHYCRAIKIADAPGRFNHRRSLRGSWIIDTYHSQDIKGSNPRFTHHRRKADRALRHKRLCVDVVRSDRIGEAGPFRYFGRILREQRGQPEILSLQSKG